MVEIILSKSSMTTSYEPSKPYIEGACLSTDDKPVGYATGSKITEVDTGKLFMYSGSAWVEQFSYQNLGVSIPSASGVSF